MKLMYISNACPPEILTEYEKKYSKKKIRFVQQLWDFHLSEAFYNLLKSDFCAVSFPPITTYPVGKCLFHGRKTMHSRQNNDYVLLPTVNIAVLKQFLYCVGLLFELLIWSIKNRGEKKVIITNCIYPQSALPSFLIRCFSKTKVFTILPDLPEHSVPNMLAEKKWLKKLYSVFIWLSKKIQNGYNGYICFTRFQMEHLIQKPNIVIDGMIDTDYIDHIPPHKLDTNKRIIVYAGGILEKYGIQTLAEAFIQLNPDNAELWFYGTGDSVDYLRHLKSDIVFYKGAIPRDELIGIEKSAYLLVNPRPTDEEYSKCSFPSKLMEYMATGTPVLTSRLLCIGEEYDDLMYFFDDISVQGIKNRLESLLNGEYQREIGCKARQEMKLKKNVNYQAERICAFVQGI